MTSTNWSDTLEAKQSYPLGFMSYPIFNGTGMEFIAHFVKPTDTLLEFGCGPHRPLSELKVEKYYTLDSDKKVKPDFTRIQDAAKIKFDVIASNVVLEHLTADEIRETFHAFKGMTKRIVFVVPNAWANYGVYASDYTHRTHLAIRGWGGLLREAGIENPVTFYRISPSKWAGLKNGIARLNGVDFCELIGGVVDIPPTQTKVNA